MPIYLSEINKDLQPQDWQITCELFAPNAPQQNPVEDIWLRGKNHLRKTFADNDTFAKVKKSFFDFLQLKTFDFPKLNMYQEFVVQTK